jgi:hypothetical protein
MKKPFIIIVIVVMILTAAGLVVFYLVNGSPNAEVKNINVSSGTVSSGIAENTVSPGYINQSAGAGGSSVIIKNGTSPTNAGLPSDYIGKASQILGTLPTSAYLQIGTSQGTVQVKNFYLLDPPITEAGDIFLKQGNGYWFVYDPNDSSFWVAVSGAPFDTVRQTAEQDFIATIGTDEASACKLAVSVGAPYSPGNPINGQSFPLSFCASSTFGQ